VSSFCLRYRAIDVGLEAGELVVGREEGCGLVVDDALVSRQHARFRVTVEGVEVEDLGSRNGVHVNGTRVTAPTRLDLGDAVRIGSQVLVLARSGGRQRGSRPLTSEMTTCARCGGVAPATATTCPTCHVSLHPEAGTEESAPPQPAPHPVRSSFRTLSALADKALGFGRGDEAERILASALDGVLQEAASGAPPSDDGVREAVSYALKLAEAGVRPRLDYVFQLYTVLGRMMSADEVEHLYRVTTAGKYTNARNIRSYLDSLRPQAGSLGANERFLLQRLEGLERRVRSG
jgi:predicted component of type VI protein secretion system